MADDARETLGRVYERSVAAGVVQALRAEAQVLSVTPWDPAEGTLRDDLERLSRPLRDRPDAWEPLCGSVIAHGHLHGQTLARRWIAAVPGVTALRVMAPPSPGPPPDRATFAAALDLAPEALGGALYEAGGAARADLVVLGRASDEAALLVVECSLALGGSGDLPDPRSATTWRELISRAAFRNVRVGGFANLRANIEGVVGVEFPDDLRALYRTLASARGASKLYQGCAYAAALAPAIAAHRRAPVQTTVASSTMLGFEHLSATCPAPGGDEPATWRVLRSCGAIYPGYRETSEGPDAERERLFDVRAHLREAFGGVLRDLGPDEGPFGPIDLRVEEAIDDHPRLEEVRADHARAVESLLSEASPGEVLVGCLMGAPGIGKTTAIRSALLGEGAGVARFDEGWCYLYVSPRVAINDEQFRLLSDAGRGVCGLTARMRLADAVAAQQPYAEGFAYVAGDVAGLPVNTPGEDWRRLGRSTWLFDREAAGRLEREGATSDRHGVHRLADDTLTARVKHRQAVLRGLTTAAREVVAARKDLRRIALAMSLQALRGVDDADLDALFTSAARFDPAAPASRRAVEAFARRFPTVMVLLDEVTGEEGAPSTIAAVRRWLHSRFVEPFKGAEGPRVVLLISDASLTSPAALQQFLALEEAPPRVLVSSVDHGPTPVRREEALVRFGRRAKDRQRCVLVRGDAYPASRLTVGYRVVLTTVTGVGVRGDAAGAIELRRRERLARVVVQTLEEQLSRADGQVLCFLQDKSQLSQIRKEMVAAGVVDDDDVLELTADTSPAEKRRLDDEARRDSLRLVLMTSSGARGISFRRATRLVAFLPPWAPEQNLMEFVQFAYRGRGGGFDGLARHIEVVVLDAMDDAEDARTELRAQRRHADLLAFALVVRATLHTRIFGSYRRPDGARIALIPVARTGARRSPWHQQRVLRDLEVASARHRKRPVVDRLVTAAFDFFEHIQYRLERRLPRCEVNRDRSWEECLPPLVEGASACGPMLVVDVDVSDRTVFSSDKVEALKSALRVFLGVSSRGDFGDELVHVAKRLDMVCDVAAQSKGFQQYLGLGARARAVLPVAWESLSDALRAITSEAEASEEHGRWQRALGQWVDLATGLRNADRGGISRRFQRFPFALLFDDADPTDLDSLGARNVARAGLLANALAALVFSRRHQA